MLNSIDGRRPHVGRRPSVWGEEKEEEMDEVRGEWKKEGQQRTAG